MVIRAKTLQQAMRTTALVATALSATMAGTAYAGGSKTTTKIATTVDAITAPTADAIVVTVAPTPNSNSRPFVPLAGNIRSFAGPISGSAGNIRSFSGETTSSAGNIRSFAGNIRSFAGNIRSFQAEVLPVSGTNTAFWGTLTAQGGTATPSAGNIRSFSGLLDAYAGNIRSFTGSMRASDGTLLTYTKAPTVYKNIATQISGIVSLSKTSWGAAVTARTGKTFEAAFSDPMLTKYGIDLKNPGSLYGLNEIGLEMFLLDWNDNIMNYSGRDQTDHWMKEVNWTPSLTQQVTGGGLGSKIGILDFSITGSEAFAVSKSSGISTETGASTTPGSTTMSGGHGTAVASLIFAPHDGMGVMGIAPDSDVIAYNPFDSTMTAGWSDIKTGIEYFINNKVSVVNMSLGVPGWTLNQGWADVFTGLSATQSLTKQLYVIAAGNDGVVQPGNINWDIDKSMAFIVVGSVDPSGKISSFSNTPGTACLLKTGTCESTPNLLMNHYMVAPGEFMLVDDGAGNVTRMSGTSFAAPLVSGTASLIADRWPWLTMYQNDIADIILSSATDLGATGVDAVYGHGLLNVQAALSPLSLANLNWKVNENGVIKTYSAASIGSVARSNKAAWELNGAYVTVYEGTSQSYRDFNIPLSSKLVGQTVGLANQQFQFYMQDRFWSWIATQPLTATTSGLSFTDGQMTSNLPAYGKIHATMSLKPRQLTPGLRQGSSRYDTALTLSMAENKVSFQFGSGNGAVAIGGQSGFQMSSDYDVHNGGANPYLALAAGSGFASVSVALNSKLTLSSGFTSQNAVRDIKSLDPATAGSLATLTPYRANANNFTLTYKPNARVTANLSYTMLNEKSGLLGVQSLDVSDFSKGTQTDAATVGVNVELTPSLALAASGTMGRTRSSDLSQQNLAVSGSGLISTAFQVSLTKARLLSSTDSARITFSQPLHLENGSVDVNSVEVVNRQTGELGVVQHSYKLQGQARSYVAEGVYRLPLKNSRAEFSLFGRGRIGGNGNNVVTSNNKDASLTVGAGFRIGF